MKHLFKIVLLLGVMVPLSMHAQKQREAVNKTTFVPHGFFSLTSPERTVQFSPSWTKKNHDSCHVAMQMVPFYSQSTHECELATFFLPFGSSQMQAGEMYASSTANRDIDAMANYFSVQTAPVVNSNSLHNLTFESTLNFKARQNVFGIGFDFVKGLCENWWAEIAFPVVRVENQLCMHENVTNVGNGIVVNPIVPVVISNSNANVPAGASANMTEAFKSDYLKYGRIDSKRVHKWGVADVELSIGNDWLNNDTCLAYTQAGVIIPTGSKPDPRRVFSPFIGNAKHAGIFVNSHVDLVASKCEDYTVTVKVTAESKYSFKNTQCRSFDLVGKPWSRYLWVTQSPEDLANLRTTYTNTSANTVFIDGLVQPAINFLTQPVVVRPRSSFDYQAAVAFDRCNFHAEAGFTGHFRQAENICLARPWQEGPGILEIYDVVDQDDVTVPTTRSYSLINAYEPINNDTNILTSNAEYISIKEKDLDLNSAAHPAVFTRSVFASIGYQSEDYSDLEYMVNLGGSYEFAHGNAAIERWTAWLKGGIAF